MKKRPQRKSQRTPQVARSRELRPEDVRGPERRPDGRGVDARRNEAEITRYFQRRLERMTVVRTTQTPLGQTIDWIPAESQVRPGDRVAAPPSPGLELVPPRGDRVDRLVRFELEDPRVERGPSGTVPVLRKDLRNISLDQSLEKLLGKYPGARLVFPIAGSMRPVPAVGGPHRYGNTNQTVICFGGDGYLSAFDPYCENPDDFSLMQIGLANTDTGRMQTVEAGWQGRKNSYGDWLPHLFLYYTTNGYTDDGDDRGGYNQDVDGWVQYDGSIHPGAISSPNSTRGGDQYVMQIKFQLYEGNWWFMCNGRWLGYYPASLFMGNRSVFSTLGDHAGQIAFYGEVFDSDEVPGKTRTDMGSGYWPEYGWQWAAYQRNLRVQTDRAGGMANYDGAAFATDPDMYDLTTHMNSGSDWGSYFWVGGPGA